MSFNVLKLWLLIEQEKDAAVHSVEVRTHEHFSHGDSVEFFGALGCEGNFCDRADVLLVEEAEKGVDHE